MEAAARKAVPAPALDMSSLHVCRIGRTGYAYIETVSIQDATGAEQWKAVNCFASRKGRGKWECSTWPFRGFHVDAGPGQRAVPVAIVDSTDLDTARRWAAQAFALLKSSGETGPCFEDKQLGVKSFSALHRELGDEFTQIDLQTVKDGFLLTRGSLDIYFQVGAGVDAEARIECWHPVEVVVTG
jgi:hypothetical protein